MTWVTMVTSCFIKSLKTSGRATRTEFWTFLPVGLIVVAASITFSTILGLSVWAATLIAFVSALPLFSVGSRRLQDCGEDGEHAIRPWIFFAVGINLGNWGLNNLIFVENAFSQMEPPDGPGGLAFVIVYGWGGTLLVLLSALSFLVFLNTIVSAVSFTLLPSQVGPNKYGSNPHEEAI